jgi:hypothetical protein
MFQALRAAGRRVVAHALIGTLVETTVVGARRYSRLCTAGAEQQSESRRAKDDEE